MDDIAGILKAFGEDTRLRILRLVAGEELAVNELVEALGVPQSRISRHLSILKQLGLVSDRREGNWIYYQMDPAEMGPVAKAIWQALPLGRGAGDYHPQDWARLETVVAKREERSKAYFEGVHGQWEQIRRSYIDDPFSSLVVSGLAAPGAVAVDVGTGTGEFLMLLAQTGARVIGVDNSEKMLETCRARVAEAGLTNVELRQGDAEKLPIDDGACDVAFSSMTMHHLSAPAQGAKELARVVKPGGRVVVSDLVKHNADWVREVMADLWLGFTEEQMCQWLTEAGLTDIVWSSTAIPQSLQADTAMKLRSWLAGARRLVASRPSGASEKLRAFIASGTKPTN